ncbi:MAG: hypothetical protein ACYDAN_12535, partial [Candidatus Limnocylindrales bacterium]
MTSPATSLTTTEPGLRARLDLPRRITLLAAGVIVAIVLLLLVFITWNGVQLFVASGVPLAEIFSPTWQPDARRRPTP